MRRHAMVGFGNAVGLFFRKLALMVGQGVPLAEALDAIAHGLPAGPDGPGGRSGRVRAEIGRVAEAVRRGAKLSGALEHHPELFPADLVAIVRSAEAAGNLAPALSQIADALEDGTLRAGRRRMGLPWFARFFGHGHHERHGHHEHHAHHDAAAQPGHPPAGGPPFPMPPPPRPTQPPPAGDVGDVGGVTGVLAAALATGATDIHVDPAPRGGRVRFRVDGRLREHARFDDPEGYRRLVDGFKTWAGLDPGERRAPQDARVAMDSDRGRVNLRVAVSPYLSGEGVAVRLAPMASQVPSLDVLGLAPADLARVRRWLSRGHGTIVVTGPTGGGKTTLLCALATSYDAATSKVVSVEQPVEYVLDGVNQLQLAPELGLTWQTALRAQLRQDPDVLLVGEVPSPEVADVMFKAALTGHVVLTTMHAESCATLFGRLLAVGLEPPLMPDALTGVIAMRLVRQLCSDCRERDEGPALPPGLSATLPPGTYYRPRGCEACGRTGYRGRIAIYELAEPVPALLQALASGASGPELAATLKSAGFRNLFADGLEKAAQGLTSIEEVVREALV